MFRRSLDCATYVGSTIVPFVQPASDEGRSSLVSGERGDSQPIHSTKAASCSVSRLLDGINAEHLKIMQAEFARHGGRLDLQQVRID